MSLTHGKNLTLFPLDDAGIKMHASHNQPFGQRILTEGLATVMRATRTPKPVRLFEILLVRQPNFDSWFQVFLVKILNYGANEYKF